jgi:hypothetical protein
MLALSFLVLIGTNLVAEGAGFHIPKGYTYFAMAFSVLVEMLNIKLRGSSAVTLHQPLDYEGIVSDPVAAAVPPHGSGRPPAGPIA